MEKYKQKVRTKRSICIGLLLLVVLCIPLLIGLNSVTVEHISSFTQGVQLGVFLGLSLGLVTIIYNYSKALKNIYYLEKAYIKETDERSQVIKEKTYTSTLVLFIYCLCLALIISGFYNFIIFVTILVVIIFLIIIIVLNYFYYNSHY